MNTSLNLILYHIEIIAVYSGIFYLPYFCKKHRLWVPSKHETAGGPTPGLQRTDVTTTYRCRPDVGPVFLFEPEAVLTSTNNLRRKIKYFHKKKTKKKKHFLKNERMHSFFELLAFGRSISNIY